MKKKNKWVNAEKVKEMRRYFTDNEVSEILGSISPVLVERYCYTS